MTSIALSVLLALPAPAQHEGFVLHAGGVTPDGAAGTNSVEALVFSSELTARPGYVEPLRAIGIPLYTHTVNTAHGTPRREHSAYHSYYCYCYYCYYYYNVDLL